MFRLRQVKGDLNPKPATTCVPFHHIPDITWKKTGYSQCLIVRASAETAAGCASEALMACMLWIWQPQNLDKSCLLKVS